MFRYVSDSYEEADRCVSEGEQSTIGDEEDFPSADPAIHNLSQKRRKKRSARLLEESSDGKNSLILKQYTCEKCH